MKHACTISIIGRPNVGKSSLFNRLLKKSTKALTYNTPGVTRDRNYALLDGRSLDSEHDLNAILVDTGGFYPDNKLDESPRASKDLFFHLMRGHAHIAINESDLVLLVVDIREGLNIFDRDIYQFLRSSGKDFWLVINKYDSEKQFDDRYPFYELGHDDNDSFYISAAHGRGVEELKYRLGDYIHNFEPIVDEAMTSKGVLPTEKVVSSVSIVGAPNAGKSTLLNLLTESERSLVSPIAGTTVDPIEGYFELDFGKYAEIVDAKKVGKKNNETIGLEYEKYLEHFSPELIAANPDELPRVQLVDEEDLVSLEIKEEDLVSKDVGVETHEHDSEEAVPLNTKRCLKIVDTAGIRKKSHIKEHIESQSVFRSLRAISESDVVIYLMDSAKGMTHHDRRLIDIAFDKGKSVILVFNKYDELRKTLPKEAQRKEWMLDIRDEVPWLNFCEIINMSALKGQNAAKLITSLKRTIITRSRKISTSRLNNKVSELVDRNPIYVKGGRGQHFKIKYASMMKANPPTFMMFSNRSKNIPENYKRYLKRGLRESFGFKNTPIHLMFRTGKDLELKAKKL